MFGKIVFFVLLGLLLFVLWQKKRMPKVKQEESEPVEPEAKKMVQRIDRSRYGREENMTRVIQDAFDRCAAQGAKRD